MTGKVKWFNNKKGYGFIETAEGHDIFVHYTAIKGDGFKTLPEGATVAFDVSKDENGKSRAINVELA